MTASAIDTVPGAAGAPVTARWAMAVGPVLLGVLLLLRGTVLAPGALDPAVTGVGIVVVALASAIWGGHRWAALAVGTLPFVLVLSPAGPELAFGLARPGDRGWFAFVVLTVVAGGGCLATAGGALVRGSSRGGLLAAALPVGVLVTGGLLAAVHGLADDGAGLPEAERAALPVVDLVDFAFASQDVDLTTSAVGESHRLRLRNDTGLPHTFTVDEVGVDVYVPPGREAVVRMRLDGPATAYCAVGDHRELGMVLALVGRPGEA